MEGNKRYKIFLKKLANMPVVILLILTSFLFTGAGVAGKTTIYHNINHDIKSEPILKLVFAGIQEDIYPWEMKINFHEAAEAAAMMAADGIPDIGMKEQHGSPIEGIGAEKGKQNSSIRENDLLNDLSGDKDANASSQLTDIIASVSQENTLADHENEKIKYEPIKPLRETTYQEYMNHISADIYGTVGIERAAEYEFVSVTEDYFDDVLFIGDSRIVGIRDYAGLEERADFLCETSATIYKIIDHEFKNSDTLKDRLASKKYGKIYLMVGINELGRGTTEDFIEQYTAVVEEIRRLSPDSTIVLLGIIHVSKERNDSDPIFNNTNIIARNHAIATLADNQNIFYIDTNEVLCDEAGNLNEDYTYDDIHILGIYYHLVKEFLMENGIRE